MNEIIKQIPLEKVARSLVISLLGLVSALLADWATDLGSGSTALVAAASTFMVAVSNEFRKASVRVKE